MTFKNKEKFIVAQQILHENAAEAHRHGVALDFVKDLRRKEKQVYKEPKLKAECSEFLREVCSAREAGLLTLGIDRISRSYG